MDYFTYGADEDPFIVTLRGIEADIHAKGWDQEHRLATINARNLSLPDGTPSTGYIVGTIPVPDAFNYNAAESLAGLVELLKDDFQAKIHFSVFVEQQFVGFLFVAEAWGLTGTTELTPDMVRLAEARRWDDIAAAGVDATEIVKLRLIYEGGDVSNHPDQVESRIAVMTIKGGRAIQLTRWRNPEGGLDRIVVVDSANSADPLIQGGIPESLVELTQICAEMSGVISSD